MKYSLAVGRFSPFHDGHKALIQKVLDEGKNVLVAIRDTEISETDPYTYEEREEMIREAFPTRNVKIIKIDDIEEIFWGRKVGWNRREIRLSPEIEEISATKIRNNIRK